MINIIFAVTFDLYDDVIDFQQIIGDHAHHSIEKLAVAKSMILQRLPEDNYQVKLIGC